MKNIKFTNNSNWILLNNAIPRAKECLQDIVHALNDNKLSACIDKPSGSQYCVKVNGKIVLNIAVKEDGKNNSYLHLHFTNATGFIYIDNVNDFRYVMTTWYQELMRDDVFSKQYRSYIRKSIHSIEEVLSKVIIDGKKGTHDLVEFEGDKIHMASERYKTFATSGTKCVKCGLEAKYFAKERTWKHTQYHFNLYGVGENNKEVLFTKDHIIPRSKGGKNHLSNYQTMCSKCNEAKGNNI